MRPNILTGNTPILPARISGVAANAAYAAYAQWREDTRQKGAEYIRYARSHGKKIAVLCGRPYHIDPEINHGINRLLTSLGMVVISEDCVSDLVEPVHVDVLNPVDLSRKTVQRSKIRDNERRYGTDSAGSASAVASTQLPLTRFVRFSNRPENCIPS